MLDNDNAVASPNTAWCNWYEERQEHVFHLMQSIIQLIDTLGASVENMQVDECYHQRSSLDNFRQQQKEVDAFRQQTGDLGEQIQLLSAMSFSDITRFFDALFLKHEADIEAPVQALQNLGFPDICEYGDSFTKSCQYAHQKMESVLKKIMFIMMHTASHHKNEFAGEVLMRYHKLEIICEALALLSCPFDELATGDQRAQRLLSMLDNLKLTASHESVVNGQNQLRVISSCLARDDKMSEISRHEISEKLRSKVSQSSCMSYITKCEFYSLLMLLLSEELDADVHSAVQSTLQDKLRREAMPDTQKLDYYICFLEMLDIHSDNIDIKQKVLTHMLGEITYDIERTQSVAIDLDATDCPNDALTDQVKTMVSTSYDSVDFPKNLRFRHDPAVYASQSETGIFAHRASGSLTLASISEEDGADESMCVNRQYRLLERMFKIRLESYVCLQYQLEDYIKVLTKQHELLMGLSLMGAFLPLQLVAWKLKIHTLVNLIAVQNRFSMSRPCTFLFFVSPARWFSSDDIDLHRKRFTETIWADPSFTLDEISRLYSELESIMDDAFLKDMSLVLSEMIDQLWSDHKLDGGSIHGAFKDARMGLGTVAVLGSSGSSERLDCEEKVGVGNAI